MSKILAIKIEKPEYPAKKGMWTESISMFAVRALANCPLANAHTDTFNLHNHTQETTHFIRMHKTRTYKPQQTTRL